MTSATADGDESCPMLLLVKLGGFVGVSPTQWPFWAGRATCGALAEACHGHLWSLIRYLWVGRHGRFIGRLWSDVAKWLVAWVAALAWRVGAGVGIVVCNEGDNSC